MAQETSREEQIVSLLKALAPTQGYNLTPLKDVRLLRSDQNLSQTPVLYDPGIVIVCQGCKKGYFGDKCYIYDAQQYLAVSVPVPFTMQTIASKEQPLLAIYIHLDFELASKMLLQMQEHGFTLPKEAPQSMMSTPMDDALKASVLRFLQVLSQPLEAAVLGQTLLQELYFHFLSKEQGNVICSALSMQGPFAKINSVLKYIHNHYKQPLTLPELANSVSMSVPTFHSHFKAITALPPMQYVKSVRLHQARMLMARQSMTAVSASYAVGYESPSQFNREFKRLFGLPPAEEVKRMKAHFAIPPAQAINDYVSSH